MTKEEKLLLIKRRFKELKEQDEAKHVSDIVLDPQDEDINDEFRNMETYQEHLREQRRVSNVINSDEI